MKRSKIFLGITTGILAIAGVAAAKSYGTLKSRLYCTQTVAGSTHYCASTSSTFKYTKTAGSSNLVTTIVAGTSGNVTVPVYTKGTTGQICDASNCINQLVQLGN